MTRGAYSQILTAIERDPTLSSFDKRLLRRLIFFSRGEGYCWARNERLAEDLACTERSITRGVSRLRAAGFIDWEFRGRRGARGNADRLLRPTPKALRVDSPVYPERQTSLPCKADRVDSPVYPHDLKRKEMKREAEADARTPARETVSPAPAAAAASQLSLEERARHVFGGEAGRKGGEAASSDALPCRGTAALAGFAPPPPGAAAPHTPPSEESDHRPSEAADPPEVATAAAELLAAGVNGGAQWDLARAHTLSRIREVIRRARRQKFGGGFVRKALERGWEGDPEPESEAARAEGKPPAKSAEEKARERWEALSGAWRLGGERYVRVAYQSVTEHEIARLEEEAEAGTAPETWGEYMKGFIRFSGLGKEMPQ